MAGQIAKGVRASTEGGAIVAAKYETGRKRLRDFGSRLKGQRISRVLAGQTETGMFMRQLARGERESGEHNANNAGWAGRRCARGELRGGRGLTWEYNYIMNSITI